MALLTIRGWSQRKGGIPAELALFGAFIAWGVLTGLPLAQDQPAVLAYGRLLTQELVLALALAEYVTERREPTFAFLLLFVVPLGLWWYARGTGQLAIAEAGGKGQMWRAESFTSNPNFAGFLCLSGLFGVAHFLWNRKRQRLVGWPLLALPFIGLTLLASGSRKYILAVGVFALAWASIAYGRGRGSKLRSVLLLLMIAAALFLAGRYVMESTPVGERFVEAATTRHLDDKRYSLYEEGLRMFSASPLFGVGLGNFKDVSSWRTYSHSDYMETLATTGMVGFALYFSIYFVLWRRLRRVLKKRSDATSHYMAGLYQAMIVTLLVLGVSSPLFLNPIHLYVVGMMVGHARAMEQGLRSTRPTESGTSKDVTSSLPVYPRRVSSPSV